MTLTTADRSIETPRLTLRAIGWDDLEFYTRVHADPDVARFLGHGRPRTTEESRLWLQNLLDNYAAFALGQLAVVRKADGALIGRCGLSYHEIEVAPHELPQPRVFHQRGTAPAGARLIVERELGYTFARAAWGSGYASEAAGAVSRYARETLRLSRIISIIHPDNRGSLGIARKFGLRREDKVWMNDRLFDRYVWP